MPKSSMQKQKLLYLYKIMLEKTDERHPLSISEIISLLANQGIRAERKSLYDDLEILNCFGLDICKIRTSTVKYYVGSRDFELAELKLLVDAIQSSKFITHKKSLSLINKLEKLVSESDGNLLQRQVYVTNRVKTPNEKIYYNVDELHIAIAEKKQIQFKYFRWELSFDSTNHIVKVPRKNGELYEVFPLALCWDDENYYLVAYEGASQKIKHYRVDKMENITITDIPCNNDRLLKNFDIATYAKSVFSMFGGEETTVKLSVKNELIGVIADRFGTDVFITKEDDERFITSVKVAMSPQFFAWVFGFGSGIKIISPDTAVQRFNEMLTDVSEQY